MQIRATLGAQYDLICALQLVIAQSRQLVHSGGYRTSSTTQYKLRCVTGRMLAPRLRSPNRSLGKPAERAASSNSDRPVMAWCRCGDLAVGGGSSALVTCGHGAARSWIDGYEMAVNGLDAYPLPRA